SSARARVSIRCILQHFSHEPGLLTNPSSKRNSTIGRQSSSLISTDHKGSIWRQSSHFWGPKFNPRVNLALVGSPPT
ncbi:unnamed protein product, partial [Allacma fusca]